MLPLLHLQILNGYSCLLHQLYCCLLPQFLLLPYWLFHTSYLQLLLCYIRNTPPGVLTATSKNCTRRRMSSDFHTKSHGCSTKTIVTSLRELDVSLYDCFFILNFSFNYGTLHMLTRDFFCDNS